MSSSYVQSCGKYEHRSVVESIIGRELTKKEVVHHIDGNKSNNNPNNLVLCSDAKYHRLLHARQRIVDLGGDPNIHKYCSYHKSLHSRELFSTKPSSYDGLHNTCRDSTNKYRKEKGYNLKKFDWKARMHQQRRRAVNKGLASELI